MSAAESTHPAPAATAATAATRRARPAQRRSSRRAAAGRLTRPLLLVLALSGAAGPLAAGARPAAAQSLRPAGGALRGQPMDEPQFDRLGRGQPIDEPQFDRLGRPAGSAGGALRGQPMDEPQFD